MALSTKLKYSVESVLIVARTLGSLKAKCGDFNVAMIERMDQIAGVGISRY